MDPYGWPDDVFKTLRKITAMCEWNLNSIIAEPDPTPGPEEEIESVLGTAIRMSSRKRATEGGEEGDRGRKGAGSIADELCDTDRNFLRVLHKLKAFGHANKTNRKAVEQHPSERIGDEDSRHFRNSVKKLKRLGLIDTAVGPNGGVWLTPKGRDLIAS
jgi:hypothetical protein